MIRAWLLLGFAAAGGCTKPVEKPAPEQEWGAGEVAPAPKGEVVPPLGQGPNKSDDDLNNDNKPPAAWIELMGHKDPAMRRKAAVALGRLGAAAKPAIPALIRAFSDDAVCEAAIDSLGRIGPPAIPPLLEEMKKVKKEEQVLRWRAAIALGRIGPAAADAVPVLAAALKEVDPAMRVAAALSLGAIGPPAKDTVPEVVKMLKEQHSSFRFAAVAALGGFAENANSSPELLKVVVKESLPGLIEALRDEDRGVRTQAAYALGRLGPAAKDALPALTRAAEMDADKEVRSTASEAVKAVRAK
jgi:HEAT repeat protein